YDLYAFFPRDLSPGMAWTLGGSEWPKIKTCRVTAERRAIGTREVDTLRIDLQGPGSVEETLWLARGIGIVRWVCRPTLSPLEVVPSSLRGCRGGF
ncbi:MAG TPA: hypothetical protein VEN81_08180, partial [Planctomycetota bacterium]|nr:hypothetical protein [Planctomycetota bacterium]